MSRAFKSKHSKAMDAKEECKTYIKNLFAERARKGLPNDDVKDISQIVQRGGFADDGWFQLKGKLKLMLNAPTPDQGASSSYSSYGNWESAMQYVRSMVCDPAQFATLCKKASYDDERALEGLKREFDAAKSSGKKVEKHPQDWLRAKELVDRAKLGKKPQQQRSQFQGHIDDTKTSQNQELENSWAALEKDIQGLKNSGLLTREESSFLGLVQLNASGYSVSNLRDYAARVAQIKTAVAERADQKNTSASLLDRCNALLKSGKLMVSERTEMEELKSDIKMGVRLLSARQALEKMEQKAAARQAMVDVNSAFKVLLSSENAKYLEFDTLERVERTFAMRGRLASDWVQDRLSDAYLEFSENKQLGRAVNSAEKPENKALIARIDAVLAAKAIAGGNETELESYKTSLQRNGLHPEYMRMLEKLLKECEAKMKINAAANRALALDGLTSGEKDMILRMSGAQVSEQMTAGQLASNVLALHPALAKAFASCDEQDYLELGNLLARLNTLKDSLSARLYHEKPASEQKSFMSILNAAMPYLKKYGGEYAQQSDGASAQAEPAISPQALMNKADELRQALTVALLESGDNINDEKMRNIRQRVDSLKTQLWGNVQKSEMPGLIERFLANQTEASTYLEIYEVDYAPLKVGKASETAQETMSVAQLNAKIKELLSASEKTKLIGDMTVAPHQLVAIFNPYSSDENKQASPEYVQEFYDLERKLIPLLEKHGVPYGDAAQAVAPAQASKEVLALAKEIFSHEVLSAEAIQLSLITSRAEQGASLPSDMDALKRIQSEVLARAGSEQAEPIASNVQLAEKASRLSTSLDEAFQEASGADEDKILDIILKLDRLEIGLSELPDHSRLPARIMEFEQLRADAAPYLEKYVQG